MTYIDIAHTIVMAYAIVTCVVMAYIVMAYVVMARIVMAYEVYTRMRTNTTRVPALAVHACMHMGSCMVAYIASAPQCPCFRILGHV